MNIVTKVFVLAIVFLCGAGAHNFYINETRSNLVKLEKTRSGMFIIKDDKIFEVLELPTSKVSFQDE
jgi:hypothetical protein